MPRVSVLLIFTLQIISQALIKYLLFQLNYVTIYTEIYSKMLR